MTNPLSLASASTKSGLAFRLLVALGTIAAAAASCAKVQENNPGGTGASSGSGGRFVIGTGGFTTPVACIGRCTDFPATPIIDSASMPAVPGNPDGMFSGTPPANGPCISEPEDGTRYPNNWMRPRIKFTNNGKLAQIRMRADNQMNELVAYTMNDFWIIDKNVWSGLATHQNKDPVTVQVWIQGAGASTVKFDTASVPATGNLIFWAANPSLVGVDVHVCQNPATAAYCSGGSELRAFSIGSETTQPVLELPNVKQQSRMDSGAVAPVTCIGCHTGTPDSSYVLFVDNYPWRAVSASVDTATQGTAWATTPMGLNALLQPGWGPFTFTKAATPPTSTNFNYWQTGKRIMVGSLGLLLPNTPDYSNGPDQNDSPHLAWINLEAPTVRPMVPGDNGNWAYTSFAANVGIDSGNGLGFIAHDGDPYGAATPNWSHDGNTIAYVSTNAAISGRLNQENANPGPATGATQQNGNPARSPGLTNIFTVPFNNGLGGTATAVSGAATPTFEEFYPAFSPDDKFIAFTFVPAGQSMYANANAQIAIVNRMSPGTPATVLRANRPPACTGKTSPGVNNHWPKWSPEIQGTPDSGGGTYYFLIFSSNRLGGVAQALPRPMGDGQQHAISQLYMVPVFVNEFTIQDFPAIYLWNQPADRVNTTPAWETFTLPPIP